MLKWFYKWLGNKINQVNQIEGSLGIGANIPSIKLRSGGDLLKRDYEPSLSSNGTQFTLYNANGGTVVELRNYDMLNDRLQNMLYVIPSDKDLGEQLGHIVTMEALKR